MGTGSPEAIVRGGLLRSVGLEPSKGGMFGRHLISGHRHELARSTARGWPYYSLAEALAALTEDHPPAPLLETTRELGEWMQHAFPRELPPPHR